MDEGTATVRNKSQQAFGQDAQVTISHLQMIPWVAA
jgi:hypothetical protein